jgi:hypothetical protein
MGVPASLGHQGDLVVNTVGHILALIESKGTPLQFTRVPISESDIRSAVVTLLESMNAGHWEKIIVTLSGSLASVSMSIYLAVVIFASHAGDEVRQHVHVYLPCPAAGGRVEIPVPRIPLPRNTALLAELRKNPRARLIDLQESMKRHPSTISRQISKAKEYGYVSEYDGQYSLTDLGNILVDVFSPQDSGTETPLGRDPQAIGDHA